MAFKIGAGWDDPDRWDSYSKETTTTKRPRRTNGLRTEHNDIEDEDSVEMVTAQLCCPRYIVF